MDGWSKQKLFLSFLFFFSAYYYRIIDVRLQQDNYILRHSLTIAIIDVRLQQDNYILRHSLTIAKVTLSIDKKHIVKDRAIN